MGLIATVDDVMLEGYRSYTERKSASEAVIEFAVLSF